MRAGAGHHFDCVVESQLLGRCARWVSTVVGLLESRSAISLLFVTIRHLRQVTRCQAINRPRDSRRYYACNVIPIDEPPERATIDLRLPKVLHWVRADRGARYAVIFVIAPATTSSSCCGDNPACSATSSRAKPSRSSTSTNRSESERRFTDSLRSSGSELGTPRLDTDPEAVNHRASAVRAVSR